MPDDSIACPIPQLPTRKAAESMYRTVRQELHGLGPDAYQRESARRLGIDVDTYNGIRLGKDVVPGPKPIPATKPSVPKPEVPHAPGPLKVDNKAEENILRGKPVMRDGQQVGWYRKVEIQVPQMVPGTSYASGFTRRIEHQVRNMKGEVISQYSKTQTQALQDLEKHLKPPPEQKLVPNVPKAVPKADVLPPASPADWVEVSRSQLIADTQLRLQKVNKWDAERAARAASRVLADTRQFRFGVHEVSVVGNQVTEKQIQALLAHVKHLDSVWAPTFKAGEREKVKWFVGEKPFEGRERVMGFCQKGEYHITLNPKIFSTTQNVNNDWFMNGYLALPPQDRFKWYTTHEYGHAHHARIGHGGGSILDDREAFKQAQATYGHMGSYAHSDSEGTEAFAESFAEWVLTEGKTTNPAIRSYARYFKWKWL